MSNKSLFHTVLIIVVVFISSCSGQKELTETDSSEDNTVPQEIETIQENSEDPLKEIDDNPYISGFIELEEIQAVGDTIRSRLSEANIRVSDTTGIRLYRGKTNTQGEFYIELDAFIPDEPFELFIHYPREDIRRTILFIYTVEKKDDMRISLDSYGGTRLNIDYLDLVTGEGDGIILTN